MWEGLYAPTLGASSATRRGVKPLPLSRHLRRRRRGLQLGHAFAEEDADEEPVEPETLDRVAAVEPRAELVVDDLAGGGEFGAGFLAVAEALAGQGNNHARGGGAGGVGARVGE